MRMPASPPELNDIYRRVMNRDPEAAPQLFMLQPEPENHYRHWDDVRRHPAPAGMDDSEAWWFALKMRRNLARQGTWFRDTQNREFWFTEPNFIRAGLRNVDLNWGGLLGAATPTGLPTAGEARTYLVRSLAEEPFSSSFLEGAATTREIAKQLIFKGRAPRTRDERMVLNNYRALSFVKQNVSRPLTVELILETHRIVTEGTLERPEMAGVFRGTDDDIRVFDDTTGEVLHAPPSANELQARAELLCEFANEAAPDRGFIHPVVRAIIIHFMLAYDHPFVDGNGSTARALFYWSMLRSGYWLAEYASISSAINQAPVKYGRAFLETETDDADLTYFIVHQCRMIEQAEQALRAYIERKRGEVDSLASELDRTRRDGGYNHRQTTLLNDFVRRRSPSATIADYQHVHSVSYHTARNDLEELTAKGLLLKRRAGRESHYVPASGLERKLLGEPRRP